MTKTIVNTDAAPAAAGPYSQAVKGGGLVFVSGQLPIDPATGEMPESVTDQTRRALDNIAAILDAEGLTLADVMKCMVFLTDMDTFSEMNAVYAGYFPSSPPARSAYQVVKLPKGAKVEIEAIALASGKVGA
ncbi:RidA family protein [Salinarimonas rosea]|uniref:RidA family protein n=1 Tax=Salinarimonas rosea TaxID=552063 RepID=UPI000400C6F2|nr:RidA family protein [Salinarimonas rosea]